MDVFYKRDEAIPAIKQENLKPSKTYKTQCENQRRAPLQCITNGNGVKISKELNANSCVSSADFSEVVNKNVDKCLQLVNDEATLKKYYFKEKVENSEDAVILQEYGKDIWRYLFKQEINCFWPKPNYMLKQKQLTYEMRSILIDWLVAVAHEYEIQEQTIYLSVNYIDRFLCTMSVVREKFQLLGAAAMMLAIKVEEVVALDAQEWVQLTGQAYNSRQIVRMEQLLLNVLKFDLNPPTVINYVQLICALFGLDKQTLYLAMFLLELTLLEEDFLEHLPSKLAVSSVVLARYMLNKRNPYFLKLELSCGYNFHQLKPVIVKQHRAFEDSPTKQLQSIQNKYKTDKYGCVANITPLHLNFEDK